MVPMDIAGHEWNFYSKYKILKKPSQINSTLEKIKVAGHRYPEDWKNEPDYKGIKK